MTTHVLDQPVLQALRGHHCHLAIGDPSALRYDPAVHFLAAAADNSVEAQAALARLVTPGGTLGQVEATAGPVPPGLAVRSHAAIDQMVLTTLDPIDTSVAIEPLTGDAAPEMLALTTLTAPGPFFAETWRMGSYYGIRQRGELIAMAGERTRPPGFTEVSAVCTHPDHRGHGHARALMQHVIAAILARGEGAFLHVYPDNAGAIALYEAIGFRRRARMTYTILQQQ